MFNSCTASYSLGAEDKTQFYLPTWRPFPASQNTSAKTLNMVCPKPWRYSSAEQTESLPLWGKLYLIYGQGGYLADLGYDRNSATEVISELSSLNWFDKYTSAVLIEFTVFNSRVSLFSAVWIPVEFSPSGYVASSHVIRPIHVYNIGAGYSAALLVCQILLFLFIVYFIFKETKEMIQQPKHYFLQFLNWIELAQILTTIAFVVTHILKETELFANTAKLHKNIFQFISFDREVLLDDMEAALLAFLIFFNTLKLLYLFRFNSHIEHLSDVMKASFLDLVNCSLGFLVFIFAFTHFGFIQFGRELEGYSSPISGFQSLLIQGVVSDRTKHFQDYHVVIGPLFFILFNIFLQVIWINIFIAILIYDCRTAKHVSKRRFNLGKFMMRKIKEILNCAGDKQPTPNKENTTRKKHVSWKVENNLTDFNNNNNCRLQQHIDFNNNNNNNNNNYYYYYYFLSSNRTKYRKERAGNKLLKVMPHPIRELDRRVALMNERLNDLYVDECGDDIDLLSLWLDARAQEMNACEQERADTQLDEAKPIKQS